MGDTAFFFLIVGLMLHVVISSSIQTVMRNCFEKANEELTVFHYFWIWFPLINIIISNGIVTTYMDALMRTNKKLRDEYLVSENKLNRVIEGLNDDIKFLKRSKFRKVKVGDVFVFPKDGNWKQEVKGTKHVITEIDDNGVCSRRVDNVGITWTTNWDLLRKVVFLSDEPIKPFEFIK